MFEISFLESYRAAAAALVGTRRPWPKPLPDVFQGRLLSLWLALTLLELLACHCIQALRAVAGASLSGNGNLLHNPNAEKTLLTLHTGPRPNNVWKKINFNHIRDSICYLLVLKLGVCLKYGYGAYGAYGAYGFFAWKRPFRPPIASRGWKHHDLRVHSWF